jgi:hypothetical protein
MEHHELEDVADKSVCKHCSTSSVTNKLASHVPYPNRDQVQLPAYLKNKEDGESDKQTKSGLLFIVIGSLYLGTFLVALDTTIIGTAIPAITSQFHSLDQIGWYGSGYLLALTALQPTFGKLYKIVDTKLLYLISIGIFECAYPQPSYLPAYN